MKSDPIEAWGRCGLEPACIVDCLILSSRWIVAPTLTSPTVSTRKTSGLSESCCISEPLRLSRL